MATKAQVDAAHKKMMAAYRSHRRSADVGYGKSLYTTPARMEKADSRIRKLQQKHMDAVHKFRDLLKEYAAQSGQPESELRDHYNVIASRPNPRGGRTMVRRTTRKSNARAADRWGVYVKSQLAYVSTKKLDANKAASRLRLSGRRDIKIKQVGPNPISGIVPKVGWRAEFKKAAYSAMKAPGVRRKRARTTSKIRQTRQRRGENPTTGNWMVKITRLNADGSRDYLNMLEFQNITSAKRAAANYSRERGVYATIYDTFGGGQAVYQYHKGRQVAKGNPAGPSSRAVAGRIGRAVGARVKSRNPRSTFRSRQVALDTAAANADRYSRSYYVGLVSTGRWEVSSTKNSYHTYRVSPSGEVIELKRNPRRAGVGTRSVMRGSTFRGAVGRRRNPKVVIKRSKVDPTAYDLYVGGKLYIQGETFTVVDRVAESLKRGGGGRHETDDVARSILKSRKRNAPSILRRRNPTYGAKRMARMAKRGRARRSNPRRPVIITTTSDLRKGQVIEYGSAAGPKRYARVKRAARADETRSVRSIESGTHRGYVVQPIKAPK